MSTSGLHMHVHIGTCVSAPNEKRTFILLLSLLLVFYLALKLSIRVQFSSLALVHIHADRVQV